MKKRILCFGDSNTWGAVPQEGTRHPEKVRWTGLLQELLGEDYQVIEEGYRGRTTVFDDEVKGRLSGLKYFGPCCDSQSPLDLVILMLGTNDLKTRFGVNAWTIASGFRRFLNTLNTISMEGSRPKVLLVAPIKIDPAYKENEEFHDMFGEHADERSCKFAEAYRVFAEKNGLEYLDASLYGVASKRDGIHMEAESHRSIAFAMAEKVKSIFS